MLSLSYSDFRKYFEEDNLETVRELFEQTGPLTPLAAASSYSNGKRRLSANMTRVLIQGMLASVHPCHAIWMLNEMINNDGDPKPEGMTLALLSDLLSAQDEGKDVDPIWRLLTQHVGACPDPQFDQFLGYISKITLVLGLPDNAALATLERARRRLKDDRAFFLALYASTTLCLFEGLVAEVMVAQTAEAIAEGAAYQPQEPENPFAGQPSHDPWGGFGQTAGHYRRDYGRRRKR